MSAESFFDKLSSFKGIYSLETLRYPSPTPPPPLPHHSEQMRPQPLSRTGSAVLEIRAGSMHATAKSQRQIRFNPMLPDFETP